MMVIAADFAAWSFPEHSKQKSKSAPWSLLSESQKVTEDNAAGTQTHTGQFAPSRLEASETVWTVGAHASQPSWSGLKQ